MNTLYDAISHKYGVNAQIIVAIEELAELTKALTKYLRTSDNLELTEKIYNNIYEEIADVDIMIEQLKQIFDFNPLIETHKQQKLKRMESLV
jgi:hypothetical protein